MWNPFKSLTAGERYTYLAIAITFILGVWSFLSGADIVSAQKLPAPWEVVFAGYSLFEQGILIPSAFASTVRVLTTTLLVVMIGVPVGISMGASPTVNALLSPILDPWRSAPIVAILPILVMWFGIGEAMKIAFLFAGSVVFLIPLVRDAVSEPENKKYYIKILDMGGSQFEAVRYGLIPLALPRIYDGITVAVSIMWTYITVAEYVNAESGLGNMIQNARRFSAMDQVFAGILVILGLAFLTYQGMVFLRGKLFTWES
jgi:ABC-type nitrate/sulfonate/bicarbonate transport system permease component